MGKREERRMLDMQQPRGTGWHRGMFWGYRLAPGVREGWRWLRQHNRLMGTLYLVMALPMLFAIGPGKARTFDPGSIVMLALCLFCGIGLWLQKPLHRKPEPDEPPLVRHKRKRRKGTKDE